MICAFGTLSMQGALLTMVNPSTNSHLDFCGAGTETTAKGLDLPSRAYSTIDSARASSLVSARKG